MRSWQFSNFYFFYFSTIGILVPYWSLYLQHLGFTPNQIGELVAILVLTKLVAPNIWAAVADRITLSSGSSHQILKFATGFALLIFCAMFLISTNEASAGSWPLDRFWSVALITLGYSIFWNASLPQVEALTLNHLGSQRMRYGSIRLWGSIGFIVTTLALGYGLDAGGPEIILPAAALSFAAMFAASFFLTGKTASKPIDRTRIAWRLLLNRRIIIILVLCTLMQASHAPFYTFFSIYLEQYGYSKAHIGWLWSVGVVFEILVFMTAYRLLRQYRLISLLTFTFFIAAIRWCLVAAFPERPLIMLGSQMLHAITYGLYHCVMIQLIDQFFQGRYQIRGQALYSSVSFGIGGALGSVVSGYAWVAYGANTVYLGAGLLMFLATLLSMLLVIRKPEQLPIRTL